MGIRETLGVGRTTKIKLVDRQRNRLDEELHIITRNAINSNDIEMQTEQLGKAIRIAFTGTTYLKGTQDNKNAKASLETAKRDISLIPDKHILAPLKPVLTTCCDALISMSDLIQRGNFIGLTSAVLTDKVIKQSKRKR